MQLRRSALLHKLVAYLAFSLNAASMIYAAVMKADVSHFPAALKTSLGPLVLLLQANGGWILPSLLVLVPAVNVFKGFIGNPKDWEQVHELLDQLRNRHFNSADDAHFQNHRVTLFRYYRTCVSLRRWPWTGGWLRPVERSGHTSRNTKCLFRAPDDGERCEGVAGAAWSKSGHVYLSGLDDMRAGPSEEQIAIYARKTNVSPERIKKDPPQGRSFWAIRVEVNGVPWGVIVVDSIQTTLRRQILTQEFGSIAKPLSRILSRV